MRPGFDPKLGRIKTDAPGVVIDRAFIAHYQIAATSAIAASNTAVHAAITLPAEGTTVVTTAITSPAVPRGIRIKGNAVGITGNVVIAGTNYAGDAITETIIAADAGAIDGLKAFKTVTSITVPVRATAGDTISVGFSDKLGLPYKLYHNTVLAVYHDNAKEGTAPTVTVSATTLESNTVDLDTALNAKIVDVYLMV